MEVNWTVLFIVALCAIILIVYLIRRNLKDENKVIKFFNEEVKTEKKFEIEDDEW